MALARASRSEALELPRRAPWIALGADLRRPRAWRSSRAPRRAPPDPRRRRSAAGDAAEQPLRVLARRRAGVRHEPLRGVGAGGWSVYWLRYRPFDEGAQDAHSLPLQTAAELGLVGLALLAVFLAGVGIAARRCLRAAPALAAGPLAGFVVYVAHSPLDWDWEMPAVTLIAIVLAGLLIALGEGRAQADAVAPAGERERPVAEVGDNPAMRAARLAIAALAVAACAWFVIGAIQSHNESRATALINGGGTPTPAQTAQIGHWLDTAATLNPDRNIDLLRAQAEVRAGQSARALVLMKRVVGDEPATPTPGSCSDSPPNRRARPWPAWRTRRF